MIAKDTQQQNKITGEQTFFKIQLKKYSVGAFEFGQTFALIPMIISTKIKNVRRKLKNTILTYT